MNTTPAQSPRAESALPRIEFVRCLGQFEIEVRTPMGRHPARGNTLLFHVIGSPLQLSHVVPCLRYAVRKMRGLARKTYLRQLSVDFQSWQARAGGHDSFSP